MDFYSPRPIWLQSLLNPQPTYHSRNQHGAPNVASLFVETSQTPDGRSITLEHFHLGSTFLFLPLGEMNILDTGLSSLPMMLLPVSPSVDLQHILFTLMAFHTALLLTGELISQLMKCIRRLVLLELASLTMFPVILKHQPSRTGGMLFGDLDLESDKPGYAFCL